uniref:Uncharacterized protein n=1 Tax=Tanacetum cinerariifolium TaxID=118510 RepID=A0A699VI06_TANCI|nr:hypothetical protein [Tanacetum cinerariifolium]
MQRRRVNRRGFGPLTSPRMVGCVISSSTGCMQGSLSRESGEGPRSPFHRKCSRVTPRDKVRSAWPTMVCFRSRAWDEGTEGRQREWGASTAQSGCTMAHAQRQFG